MKKTDPALKRVEAALDALRRGEAVRLAYAGGALCLRAAEWADAAAGPFDVALSARRAAYLGLGAQAAVVRAERLHPLLYAARPETPPAARPASAPEALAVDLVKLAGLLPAALLHETAEDAPTVSPADMEAYRTQTIALALDGITAMPLRVSETARLAAFRERGGITHLAVLVGEPEKTPAPLVRLHSSCLTGDLLGSLRCDCGSQLSQALSAIAAAGQGALLYLNQEGRGIGLLNKLRAYRLQEAGLDTVDANLALGFEEDERDFSIAAQMLKTLGIRRIRLLTNNPEKVGALAEAGVEVAERVPLVTPPGEHNKDYLNAKAKRMGHQF